MRFASVVSVLVIGLGACGSEGNRQAASEHAAGSSAALAPCPITVLPTDAARTVELIRAGGPFPYRHDGIVFGNRERILPMRRAGYYHEYTVAAPGSSSRGIRRIVAGGKPLTDPPHYFYTNDHYQSFCEITGVARSG